MNETDDFKVLYTKFLYALKFVKLNNFEHLKSKYNIGLFEESEVGDINDVWEEIRESSKIVIINIHNVDLSDLKQKSYMKSIVKRAGILHFIDDSINSISEKVDFETSPADSGWNLEKVELDFDFLNMYLSSFLKDLNFFAKRLPEIKRYVYSYTRDEYIEGNFYRYIEIGDLSRSNRNYKNSNIYKLEQLLVNRKDFVKDSVRYRPTEVKVDKSFIALVAPSLTGKTQSAFTIDKIRPLYFTMTYQQFRNQSIYLKFKRLSEALKEAAEKDYMLLKSSFRDPENENFDETDKILYNISSNNLETTFKDVKFFTLGLFVKLIEYSELDEKGELRNGKNWMRFHAERESFNYSAKSINDINASGSKFLDKMRTKYYLFLDEFVGHYWAILIRNLARCLELGVVVANTNSDISNLIEKVHSSSSRGGRWDVWSFVVVKLDKTDWELISNCSALNSPHKLMDKIKIIIEKSSDYKYVDNYRIEEMLTNLSPSIPHESKFITFFRNLIYDEIPKLRPGISFLIVDFIIQFNVESDYNLSKFLDELILYVMDWVRGRKQNIKINIQGIMGTMALYLSNAYDKTRIKPECEHRKSYLNDHLYYLNNPAKDDEWMFLTFPFEGNVKSLLFCPKILDDRSKDLKEWEVETTHFDGDELFTLLTCLFMKSDHSVAFDLEQGHLESVNRGFDTSTTSNPVALKLDGNKFEVLAAVSIIDASHREHGSLIASLGGQSGSDFIKNIIGNIIRTRRYLRGTKISLNFPESSGNGFSLNTFLDDCTIPFLYPANVEVPQFLQRLTNEGTIKIGYCSRTKDETKIDFKFGFEYSNKPTKKAKASRKKFEKYFAVAECKNWTKAIDSTNLITILEKSYAQKESFLSLLFCNEITQIVTDDFKKFCQENLINVYKIESLTEKFSFHVQSLHECKALESPEMVCIIFETKVINNIEIVKGDDDE